MQKHIYYPHIECGVCLPPVVTLRAGVPISQGSHVSLVRGSWFFSPPHPHHWPMAGVAPYIWIWRYEAAWNFEVDMPRKKTQLAIDHGKCFSSSSPMLSFSDTYPRASLTHPPAAPYRIVQDNYKGLYGGQLWGYAAQSQSLCIVAPHEAAQFPH